MNILELRANPTSKSNGIVKYCDELYDMFSDDPDVNILPVQNLPMKRGRLLRERYTNKTFDIQIKSKAVDVVHINGYAAFIVFQAFLSAVWHKKKIVYTPHWHPFQYLAHPGRGRFFFYCLIKPMVKYFADVVITLNNEDTAFFSQFHHNVIKIPHWTNFHLKDNNTEKNPKMILFVGRLTDGNKGFEHLFYLPEGKFEIHCVGAGKRDLRSDMIHHENISNEELASLFAKASLLVVPSRYEAFSYVTLEALCHKTPVLLSDRVRIYDYINGIKGVGCFHYQDYGEFCRMVDALLCSDVDVSSVLSIFNVDKIRNKYKEVFSQC